MTDNWNQQPQPATNGWGQPLQGGVGTLPPMPPGPPQSGNWFSRHKVLTGLGALVIIGGIGAAAGGSGGTTATQQPDSSSSAFNDSSTPIKPSKVDNTPAKPAKVDGLQADGKSWVFGDWKLSAVKISGTDYINWFKISADVKYLGQDNSGGDKCFNIALDKGDRQVASGMGCASNVTPGKTTRVDFATTDDFVPGPYDVMVTKSW